MTNLDEIEFRFQTLVENIRDAFSVNKKMLVAAKKDNKSGEIAYYQGSIDTLEELLDSLGEV